MATADMGDMEEHHLAVSEASLARRKLVDRIVVGGVSVISGVIVIFVILFVVVDKMNQAPESALIRLPNPFEVPIIEFQRTNNETIVPYIEHLIEYLELYATEQAEDDAVVDCSTGRCPTGNKVCRFHFHRLGDECVRNKNFGFNDGQPCLLFSLRPPKEWEPENFNKSTIPPELVGRWDPHYLGMVCRGKTKTDRRRIGPLEYYPPEGFPMSFFPYLKKPNFRPPLMMLKFRNPTPDVVINIRCRLLSPNTDEEPEDVFMTEFQLRIIEDLNITTIAEQNHVHLYGPTKPTDFDFNTTGSTS